jgi:carbonic anhydrase
VEKLVEGFKKFQSDVFAAKRALFTRLSEGQAPRALFITCSDSRVDPTLLTQAEPGELFILRNAGNIVPSYGGGVIGGNTATIEYAVAVLGVKHVIVCGHTDCGVIKALLHPESVKDLPAVRSWMEQAETTRRIVEENYADRMGDELLIKAIQENVRVQLDHLKTHPTVAVRLRRGGLTLHGWVYSISTGDIWAYDEGKGLFESLAGAAT